MWGKDFRDIPHKTSSNKNRNRRRHDKGWNAAEKNRTMRDPEYVPESHCRAARLRAEGRHDYWVSSLATMPSKRIIRAQIIKYGALCPEDILAKVRKDCGAYSALEEYLSHDIRNMARAVARDWYRVYNPPEYVFSGSYPDMAFRPLTEKSARRARPRRILGRGEMYSVRLNAFHFLLNEYGEWYVADCRAKDTSPAVVTTVNDNGNFYTERKHPHYRNSTNYYFDVVWKNQLSRTQFNRLCEKLDVANRPAWDDGAENKLSA